VPQLCEIIDHFYANVEIVRHFIYCWLVVVILFCFAVDLQNRLFKNTFFLMLSTLEMVLWWDM